MSIDGGLQCLVGAVGAAIPFSGRRRAPELRKERASSVTGAGDLSGVDIQKREAAHRMGPDVAQSPEDLKRQLTLDDQVPGLDVTAVQHRVRTRVAGLGDSRQGYPALIDVGAADRWDADIRPERLVRNARRDVCQVGGHGLISIDAGELRHERQRIPAAQRLRPPRVRMVGDAVAASNHRRISDVIRESETRRKQRLAVAHAVILRNAAPAANQDVVGVRVIRLDPQPVRAPPVRIELPSQSEIDREVRPSAPAIAHVECVLLLHAVHLDELTALPGSGRRADQKSGEGIPIVLE